MEGLQCHQARPEAGAEEGEEVVVVGTPCWVGVSLSCCVVV